MIATLSWHFTFSRWFLQQNHSWPAGIGREWWLSHHGVWCIGVWEWCWTVLLTFLRLGNIKLLAFLGPDLALLSLSLTFAITRLWSHPMSVWRITHSSWNECFYLLFIMMWSIWLLLFPSSDVKVSLWMYLWEKKGTAYNEDIFLAHANEPFAIVCDIAYCPLTPHCYSGQLLHWSLPSVKWHYALERHRALFVRSCRSWLLFLLLRCQLVPGHLNGNLRVSRIESDVQQSLIDGLPLNDGVSFFLWQDLSVGSSIFYPVILNLEFDLFIEITFEQWVLELWYFLWVLLW